MQDLDMGTTRDWSKHKRRKVMASAGRERFDEEKSLWLARNTPFKKQPSKAELREMLNKAMAASNLKDNKQGE
jgi:hypothetical protein